MVFLSATIPQKQAEIAKCLVISLPKRHVASFPLYSVT
jgi:hypothetical protein